MAHAPSAVLQVHFAPLKRKAPQEAGPSWTRGPNDLEATLVFFSTIEELKLPATGPMDRATISLFPARQRYSYHTSQVAAAQGQHVPVRDLRRSRS